MYTNTFLFPDVNVWVALAHASHPHFKAAGVWMDSLEDDRCRVYFCRLTQLGLLRVLTTRAAMGDDVMTQASAWETYDLFFRDNRIEYIDEPALMEAEFRVKTSRKEASAKHWTDAYLAAFSAVTGLSLVTFDKALATQVVGTVFLSTTLIQN